jgi:hypothetical protein
MAFILLENFQNNWFEAPWLISPGMIDLDSRLRSKIPE